MGAGRFGVFASGLVIRDLPVRSSSWRARDDLTTYLRDRGVVAIADIDPCEQLY